MLFYLLLAHNHLQFAVDRFHDPVRHLAYDLVEQVFVYSSGPANVDNGIGSEQVRW